MSSLCFLHGLQWFVSGSFSGWVLLSLKPVRDELGNSLWLGIYFLFSKSEELGQRLTVWKAGIWVSQFIKVWVEESDKWPWARRWVVAKESCDKVDCFPWSSVSEHLLPRQRLYLWELVFCVVGIHGEYLLTRRSSEDFDNFHQLINAALSREDGLTEHELCNDTTDRPNIDVGAILRVAEDQLWCTVVS